MPKLSCETTIINIYRRFFVKMMIIFITLLILSVKTGSVNTKTLIIFITLF